MVMEENSENQTDRLCLHGWLASRPIKAHQQGADMHTLANYSYIIYSARYKLVDAVTRMFAALPHVAPHSKKHVVNN